VKPRLLIPGLLLMIRETVTTRDVVASGILLARVYSGWRARVKWSPDSPPQWSSENPS